MRVSLAQSNLYKVPLSSIYNFPSVKIAHNNLVSIGKLAKIVDCGRYVWRENHFSHYFYHGERERERERCKWLTNETVSVCLATPGSSHFGVDWEDLSLWSHWPISGPRWVWAGANITAQGWSALCSVILLVLSGSRLWYNWYYHSQAMTPHKIHIREGLDISSFY